MKRWQAVFVFLTGLALTMGGGTRSLAYHSSDCKPADNVVSLSELLRTVQFIDSRAFHCDPAGEVGFSPGAGPRTGS